LTKFHKSDSQYRFSLITIQLNIHDGKIQEKISNPKRYSFIFGEDTKIQYDFYSIPEERNISFNFLASEERNKVSAILYVSNMEFSLEGIKFLYESRRSRHYKADQKNLVGVFL